MSSNQPTHGSRISGLSALGSESVMILHEELKTEFNDKMELIKNDVNSVREDIQNILKILTSNQQQTKNDNKVQTPTESRKNSKDGVTINITGNVGGSPTLSGGTIGTFNNTTNIESPSKQGTSSSITTELNSTVPMTETKTSLSPSQEYNLCPADNRARLPTITTLKLQEVGVTAEEFELFSFRLKTELGSISKFNGILTLPIEESWNQWKERNITKYPNSVYLEDSYLELHQQVCAFLGRHVNERLIYRLNGELKSEGKDIPTELGFIRTHQRVYDNANILWNKIVNTYDHKTVYKTGDYMDRWHNLRYDGKSDPRKFLNDYHELHAQGQLTSKNFPVLSDTAKAQDIIRKCPTTTDLSEFRVRFLREGVTVAEVTEGLLLWYAEQQLIRKSNGLKSSSSAQAPIPQSGYKSSKGVHAAHEQNSNRGRSPGRKNLRDQSRSRSRSEGRPHSTSRSSNRESFNQNNPVDGETDTNEYQNDNGGPSEGNFYSFCALSYPESTLGEPAFTGSSNTGSYYYPTKDEGIIDGGADVSITPRLDLMKNVIQTNPLRITGIGGDTSSRKEGTLALAPNIDLTKVKHVPNAKITLVAVAPFVDTKKFGMYKDDEACYVIPRHVIPKAVLIKHSILTAPRKGKFYVVPLSAGSKRNIDPKMKFYSKGRPQTRSNSPDMTSTTARKELEENRKKNVLLTAPTTRNQHIPKKTGPPAVQVRRKVNMDEEKHGPTNTGPVTVPDTAQYSGHVVTRLRSQSRPDSPIPNVQIHEDTEEEHMEPESRPESPMTPYEESDY